MGGRRKTCPQSHCGIHRFSFSISTPMTSRITFASISGQRKSTGKLLKPLLGESDAKRMAVMDRYADGIGSGRMVAKQETMRLLSQNHLHANTPVA